MSWLWLDLPFMVLGVLIAVVPLVWALSTEGRARRAEEELRSAQGYAAGRTPDLALAGATVSSGTVSLGTVSSGTVSSGAHVVDCDADGGEDSAPLLTATH